MIRIRNHCLQTRIAEHIWCERTYRSLGSDRNEGRRLYRSVRGVDASSPRERAFEPLLYMKGNWFFHRKNNRLLESLDGAIFDGLYNLVI